MGNDGRQDSERCQREIFKTRVISETPWAFILVLTSTKGLHKALLGLFREYQALAEYSRPTRVCQGSERELSQAYEGLLKVHWDHMN